jgi:type IV pilus assembly protein PilE
MKSGRQSGFTLIELMITVAIVAILASIALPSYLEYVKRGHRAAAQSEMMDIANRQQQFLLANRRYAAKADLVGSGYALPTDVGAKYGWNVTPDNVATPPIFTITFTPTGSQVSDGTLVLNSVGLKTRAGDATKW